MKKIFALLFLGLLSQIVLADPQSQEALDKLRAKVRSYTSYRLSFTAALESEGSTKGNLIVSGRRFAARVLGQELYYDGTTLWSYLPRQREVTLERLDPNNPSVLSNPSRLMNIDPADYHHRSLPTMTTGDGKSLQIVELTPKSKSPDYTAMTLYINPATSLPERISIATPGSAQPVEIMIDKIESGIPVSENTFRFEPKTHPGTEVIDFR